MLEIILFGKIWKRKQIVPSVHPMMSKYANFRSTLISRSKRMLSPKPNDIQYTICAPTLTPVEMALGESSPKAATVSTSKKRKSDTSTNVGTRCLRVLFLECMYMIMSRRGTGRSNLRKEKSRISPMNSKKAATRMYKFSRGYSLSLEPLLRRCTIFFLSIINIQIYHKAQIQHYVKKNNEMMHKMDEVREGH